MSHSPLFKINQFVEIKDTGEVYSTYKEKFKELEFCNTEKNDPPLMEGMVVKIFGITNTGNNPSYLITLYACITMNGEELLIGENGIRPTEAFIKRKIIKVSLSPKYDAFISSKGIEVGCQTITAEKLKEIIEVAKKFNLI